MSQPIDFNWVLKVKKPEDYFQQQQGVEVKGGYRIFPMAWDIAMSDWDLNIVGKIRVTQTLVKQISEVSQEDAVVAGLVRQETLMEYLEQEYPEETKLVTFIWFRVVSRS